MNMEATQEEAMGSKEYRHMMIKGKRTKRPRPSSPLALTMSTTLSNTSTSEEEEEEEDMANCLILLAQGQNGQKPSEPVVPTTTKKAAGALYLYECKTCNRCFPSFQALGGHRASHKKAATAGSGCGEDELEKHSSTSLSLEICNRRWGLSSSNKKSRVHDCSICGAEFMSGQALGGHMRRHRSTPSMGPTSSSSSPAEYSSQEAAKKAASSASTVLSLDLNLPAPEEDNDHRESKLNSFTSTGQVIVFSAASPLVDCHY